MSARFIRSRWRGFAPITEGETTSREYEQWYDAHAWSPSPERDFYLLSGPLNAYRNLPHDPNYWWPDDRAWCLCTDTDFCWAYIAGTAPCIREVLSVPELDAYETNPANPARNGMDVINDPQGTVPRTT